MSEGEPEVPTEPPSSAGTTQTAEIQANENLEEGTNEETAVIDVHAAHGGIHTWRDFWIHLGTIALGLLIAIGLEQSVEAVHRLHERHQLEADLRAEGLRNQKKAADDIVLNEKIVAWLLQLQRGVDEARDTGGRRRTGVRCWFCCRAVRLRPTPMCTQSPTWFESPASSFAFWKCGRELLRPASPTGRILRSLSFRD